MTQAMTTEIIKTDQGDIELNGAIIRKSLICGDPDAAVTDREIDNFIKLCKYRKLNPFLREAYLIKFGKYDATIVIGKDAFTKRALQNPNCDGWEAGITVANHKGELTRREGCLLLDSEKLLAGWAKVYRKDQKAPQFAEASMKEYLRKRKDGQPMQNWAQMPATMIRKVALVQALRDAFPDDLGGMYSQEEMPIDDSKLPLKEIKAINPIPIKASSSKELGNEWQETYDKEELIESFQMDISQATNIEELESAFKLAYKKIIEYEDKSALEELIELKDKKKAALEKLEATKEN